MPYKITQIPWLYKFQVLGIKTSGIHIYIVHYRVHVTRFKDKTTDIPTLMFCRWCSLTFIYFMNEQWNSVQNKQISIPNTYSMPTFNNSFVITIKSNAEEHFEWPSCQCKKSYLKKYQHSFQRSTAICGLGWCSEYSDFLWTGLSGNWILGGQDFLDPSRPALGPTPSPIQ